MRNNICWIFALCALLIPAQVLAATDRKTLKLVEYFLKTPTAKLNPDLVPRFLDVDPQMLPRRLRARCESKKLELYALRKVAQGKKEGFVRAPNDADPRCKEIPIDKNVNLYTSTFSEKMFKGMGVSFVLKTLNFALAEKAIFELRPSDIPCLEQKTQCSEQDMVCDFTLTILRTKKGKKATFRYFLFDKDVLEQVVALCRHPDLGGNTNFFGEKRIPICSH